MHWVQGLIASREILGEARVLVPQLEICPLTSTLALAPFTERVQAELENGEFPALDPSPLPRPEIAPGVCALAAKLSKLGTVMYAGTYMHGGTGGQDALVWRDGDLVFEAYDDDDNPARWPNSPISRGLRFIGVRALEDQDEFDAVGLGRYRSNESWAKGGAEA